MSDNLDPVHVKFAPMEPGEGWLLISMHDPVLRRGIWVRREPAHSQFSSAYKPPTRLELCAGREGNDDRVVLEVGMTIDKKLLGQLFDLLSWGAAMVEEDEERLTAALAARDAQFR